MSKNSIYFHSEEVDFRLQRKKEIKDWILNVISKENKTSGVLSFVFCNDDYLSKINSKYLKTKSLTDVVAFDYSTGNCISGDVFISIERVKENAVAFKTTLTKELYRVMVHGLLHLIGYSDKKRFNKAQMTEKEDLYLSLLPDK